MEDKAAGLRKLKEIMEYAFLESKRTVNPLMTNVEEDMEYDATWVENHTTWLQFDVVDVQFMHSILEEAGERPDKRKMSWGMITYEDHEKYKRLRKEKYRKQYYNSLGSEGAARRQIGKLESKLFRLKAQQFKIKCSGQCVDFNCHTCVGLRRGFDEEILSIENEIRNLENTREW